MPDANRSSSPNTKKVVRLLGISPEKIKLKKVEEFEGDTQEEKQLRYDFFEQNRKVLLRKIEIAKSKLDHNIKEKRKSEDFKKKNAVMEKENKVYERSLKMQKKELKRMCNDQLQLMEFNKKMEEKHAKELELQEAHEKEQTKKTTRKKKNQTEKEQHRKKVQHKLKIRLKEKGQKVNNEHEKINRRLNIKEMKLNTHLAKIRNQRLQEEAQRQEKHKKDLISHNVTSSNKTNKISARYTKENNHHQYFIKTRSNYFKKKNSSRTSKHNDRYSQIKRETAKRMKDLMQKQKDDEERFRKYQLKKAKALQKKREAKGNKRAEVKKWAEEKELKRKEDIKNKEKKAAELRNIFRAQQRHQLRLRNISKKLKQERVRENVKQTMHQQYVRSMKLQKEHSLQDERTEKEECLKENLRQIRLYNNFKAQECKKSYQKRFQTVLRTCNTATAVIPLINKINNELEGEKQRINTPRENLTSARSSKSKKNTSSTADLFRLTRARLKAKATRPRSSQTSSTII